MHSNLRNFRQTAPILIGEVSSHYHVSLFQRKTRRPVISRCPTSSFRIHSVRRLLIHLSSQCVDVNMKLFIFGSQNVRVLKIVIMFYLFLWIACTLPTSHEFCCELQKNSFLSQHPLHTLGLSQHPMQDSNHCV